MGEGCETVVLRMANRRAGGLRYRHRSIKPLHSINEEEDGAPGEPPIAHETRAEWEPWTPSLQKNLRQRLLIRRRGFGRILHRIRCRAINAGHTSTHGAQVNGKLATVVDAVAVHHHEQLEPGHAHHP